MVWWQLLLFIIGLCLLSILLGLLVGYIILRAQGRPWPYSWSFLIGHREIAAEAVAIPAPKVNIPAQDKKVKSTNEIQEALSEFVKKRQSFTPAPEPVKPQKSEFFLEIESNLAICTAPWTGKLTSFQTRELDSNRSRIDGLTQNLKDEIIEAYTDMRLANTLVWLSMDVGHRSKDLDDSYLKLCNKIAERLQKIITPLSRMNI
jgi:hypothetical protein